MSERLDIKYRGYLDPLTLIAVATLDGVGVARLIALASNMILRPANITHEIFFLLLE
jgi:hypothetical protein